MVAKSLENILIENGKQIAETTSPDKIAIILDTNALINLSSQELKELGKYGNVVITKDVFHEYENNKGYTKHSKEKAEKFSFLKSLFYSPSEIYYNGPYEVIDQSEEKRKYLEERFYEVSGRKRVSEADLSLVMAAEELLKFGFTPIIYTADGPLIKLIEDQKLLYVHWLSGNLEEHLNLLKSN